MHRPPCSLYVNRLTLGREREETRNRPFRRDVQTGKKRLCEARTMLTEEERPKVVVLVESDESLRDLMNRFLADEGYSVLAERDGKAGLSQFKHVSGPIDLLIVDVVMPDQTGVSIADLVKHTHPKTRILLTGYDEAGLAEEVGKLGFAFLAKPFKRRQFSAAIADILGQPPPSSDEDDTEREG